MGSIVHVPNGRRLGNVNVICVIVTSCAGRNEGGKERQWGLGKGSKSGAVDSEHGASKGRGS